MTIFMVSDTHFGHKNILFYTQDRAKLWGTDKVKAIARNYSSGKIKHHELMQILNEIPDDISHSVQKMNEGLINNWNSVINPDDLVFHDGDFMMGYNKHWESTLSRLNGKIHLIQGNHDRKFVKKDYVQNRLEWIRTEYRLKVEDTETPNGKFQLIDLCHYPKITWEDGHKGIWHFHGHCHGSLDYANKGTRIDIGVDSEHGRYFPRSYKELKRTMSTRTYEVVDNHGREER